MSRSFPAKTVLSIAMTVSRPNVPRALAAMTTGATAIAVAPVTMAAVAVKMVADATEGESVAVIGDETDTMIAGKHKRSAC